MKVSIKDLPVSMEIKSKGVELDVYTNDNKHLGDLVVTMTGLTWCKGKITRTKGIKKTWDDFITYMESNK